MRRTLALLWSFAIAAGTASVTAQDSTASLITAPRIDNLLTVSRSSDQAREQTKADFQFSLRAAQWEALDAGMTFSAERDVRIGFLNFNPLVVALSASETAAADPNFRQLSDFVDALLKVPGIVGAGQSGELGNCPAVQALQGELSKLKDDLNAARDLPQKLGGWQLDISKDPGPASIKAVAGNMRSVAANINAVVADGRKLLTVLDERAKGLSSGGGTQADTTAGQSPSRSAVKEVPPTEPAGKPSSAATGNKRNQASAKTEEAKIPNLQIQPDPCADAEVLRNLLSSVVSMNPANQERLDGLAALATSLNALAASLDRFTAPGDWEGPTYIFFRSRATAEQVKTISIKATPISYAVEGLSLNRQQQDAKAASVSFLLRQYQAAIPELGAGFVINTVKVPQYGTGTKDGKTIVVRRNDKPLSLAAALVLNWVFARSSTSSIRPIFQTGVSVSPDGPGVLLGTGFRLTRPKRVAVGFGAILAWVKDLTDLREGGPVSGTAELNDDLTYKPTVKGYFTIQYQFK